MVLPGRHTVRLSARHATTSHLTLSTMRAAVSFFAVQNHSPVYESSTSNVYGCRIQFVSAGSGSKPASPGYGPSQARPDPSLIVGLGGPKARACVLGGPSPTLEPGLWASDKGALMAVMWLHGAGFNTLRNVTIAFNLILSVGDPMACGS